MNRQTPVNADTAANASRSTQTEPWFAPLAKSFREEVDTFATIEGDLPKALTGNLFRNGPGLFERSGVRKGHVLDGDGMIRAYQFTGDGMRFRNRYVRTDKFVEEETDDRFLRETWGTKAPGSLFKNLGGTRLKSQAGVTAVWRDGRLLAFDEIGLPWELDPDNLETRGEYQVGPKLRNPAYKAHTKIDSVSGDWILLHAAFGRTMSLRVIIHDKHGDLKTNRVVEAPRQTYIHDFFATENYIIVNLHAAEFSPLGFLAGMKTFTEALTWDRDIGNLVMVIDKNGDGELRIYEAPGSWMWHALNAYEIGSEIVCDFVGYDEPDHFLGSNAVFKTIMSGKDGQANSPGTLRRWRIDLGSSSLDETIIDDGHFEFPMIDPRVATRQHKCGYVSSSSQSGSWWHDGVARIDMNTGEKESFHFGDKHYVGEPIFAVKPGGDIDQGWVLCEVFNGNSGRNGLAVFESATIGQGPVAIAWLDHSLPISFHGTWVEA